MRTVPYRLEQTEWSRVMNYIYMLGVSTLVQSSWDDFSEVTVVRCWLKLKVLPLATHVDLNAKLGNMSIATGSHNVQEPVTMMQKLSLKMEWRDHICNESQEVVTSEDL